jgi:hypothetical protein
MARCGNFAEQTIQVSQLLFQQYALILLKAQNITICTFCLCILSTMMEIRGGTTQQPLHTPTSRNNSRDMQQHSFNESF